MISIPAPARGATINHYMVSVNHLFQFPPLREGRRILFLDVYKRQDAEHAMPCTKPFQFPPLREGRLPAL